MAQPLCLKGLVSEESYLEMRPRRVTNVTLALNNGCVVSLLVCKVIHL